MIVDTSVWIAYLSTSESLASRWLADRIAADSTVIVPEVVMMELLIGKTDEDTAALRRRLLQRFAIDSLSGSPWRIVIATTRRSAHIADYAPSRCSDCGHPDDFVSHI